MQTSIPQQLLTTAQGIEADAILRSCVHCGFCNATCPTYQLLGNELDGPRGRIYQIKNMLEGKPTGTETQLHLDRCLTCRSCETTCPSGVQYGRLLDIGRDYLHKHRQRPLTDRLRRYVLRRILSSKKYFSLLTRLLRPFRPWLPGKYKNLFASAGNHSHWPKNTHTRRVIILDGCVQPSLAPDINAACARLLDKIGIQAIRIRKDGCCGAVNMHMDAIEDARRQMRHNIDTWWPYIATGADAIISTASACGLMLKDYAYSLKDDPAYSDKAARISALSRDISEVIAGENIAALHVNSKVRIAWHAPCTLQHGQKITGLVEKILQDCGYILTAVTDPHLCCGSAGTYSVLQAGISQQLLDNKLASLQADGPEIIATANIGCLLHLRSKSPVAVRHWLQLLDQQVTG